MDAQLKERAQKVAQLRNSNTRFTEAQVQEIGQVHYLLTGRKVACTMCNIYGLLNEVNQKLITEPITITDMAKAHFKPEHEKITVIRHTKNGTVAITSENLNEGDNLAYVAKHNGHLLSESKATAEATEEKPAAKTTSTKK